MLVQFGVILGFRVYEGQYITTKWTVTIIACSKSSSNLMIYDNGNLNNEQQYITIFNYTIKKLRRTGSDNMLSR